MEISLTSLMIKKRLNEGGNVHCERRGEVGGGVGVEG